MGLGPWLPSWHHGLQGALRAELPDAHSFLLWWERRRHSQGHQNRLWYWCVIPESPRPRSQQSWLLPAKQARVSLQHLQQLKESSPHQSEDPQGIPSHLETGTLVFTPP